MGILNIQLKKDFTIDTLLIKTQIVGSGKDFWIKTVTVGFILTKKDMVLIEHHIRYTTAKFRQGFTFVTNAITQDALIQPIYF